MRALLTILLFAAVSAQAQEPFQLGRTYPVSYVVTYPNASTMWISKTSVVAKTYPVEGASWTRYTPPVVKQSTPPADITSVTRATIDSLNALLARANGKLDSLAARMKVVENPPGSLTFKYSLLGTPLLKIINDSTAIIPALVAGAGISLDTTANQIIIKRN